MSQSYDAIIIGGGHNGLVCAAYLARAGRRVLVLERREVLGGAAVTEELYPGFHFSVCSYVVSLLRPQILRDLQLARHGFELIPLRSSFTPQRAGEGPGLVRGQDPWATRREIARLSPRDADLYPEFGREMARMARSMEPILDTTPPNPTSMNPMELMELLKLGKHLRQMRGDLPRLWKMLTMSAADFLDEWFESDHLKAGMSTSGIIGTMLGVRSPGTAYVMLHHYMGQIDGHYRAWGFAKGGTGGLSRAIARAAASFGAEIRTGASVEHVLLEQGQAVGVVLDNGDDIYAKRIISSADPRRTFLQMVGAQHLEEGFASQIERFRFRGCSAKVNLALDSLPEFACRPGVEHLQGGINISPSLSYLEEAYDEAKYGGYSRRPYMDLGFPALSDPSVAPPGKHILSCFVQWAPYALRGDPLNWEKEREAFGDTVLDTLEEFAPGIKEKVLFRQVLTPLDIERRIGLSEGNIYQGEMGLGQLFFMRPAAQWARYRTPVPGLWMCGSCTHPGGGIMGAPGANAARDLLQSGEV
jgi:phytoene dehydrogenase-like protein